MKKYIYLLLLLFLPMSAISEDNNYSYKYLEDGFCDSYFVFCENGKGIYYEDEFDNKGIEFSFTQEIINKLIFINIHTDNIKNNKNEIIKKILLLSDSESKFYIGFENNTWKSENRILLNYTKKDNETYEVVEASSFLIEKNRNYSEENLGILKPDTPWVEGVDGNGVGEYFILTRKNYNNIKGKPKYLMFLNGYISFNKPYLYEYNNRIKKIKITGLETNRVQIFEIKDTPQPQTIDISFTDEKEDIKVEILDVYKGIKYDDTCLTACRFSFNLLNPCIQ